MRGVGCVVVVDAGGGGGGEGGVEEGEWCGVVWCGVVWCCTICFSCRTFLVSRLTLEKTIFRGKVCVFHVQKLSLFIGKIGVPPTGV